MGTNEPNKCIFCKGELEIPAPYSGGFIENGGRASKDYDLDLDICLSCATKLKIILDRLKVKA